MSETLAERKERLQHILRELQTAYPDAHCELEYAHALDLLIATILSARCTDQQVNRVTRTLFKTYRQARDYAEAPLPVLEKELQSIGLFRNKARNIQSCCRSLIDRYGGEVPNSMEALLELDGVGRKTANVVLGNAFGINHGVVVDTHVARLSKRLALSNADSPEAIEADLQQLVPQKLWTLFSHWIIWHGRRRCDARKPDCPNCEIRSYCPSRIEGTPHSILKSAAKSKPRVHPASPRRKQS